MGEDTTRGREHASRPTAPPAGAISRRRLLAGGVALGVAGVAASCGLFDDDDGPERLSYGQGRAQFGEFWTPGADPPWPVVVMIHGGAWQTGENRTIMNPLARDLSDRGYAVWNIEYRRVGAGGGWPATFEDVGAAIDAVDSQLPREKVDRDRVILLGHSAGGHLALWGSARAHLASGDPGALPVINPISVVALAPVTDLARCADEGMIDGACAQLLGGMPDAVPERYAVASPEQDLPLGVRQRVFHGTNDEVVPISLSREYVAAAQAAGDDAELIELPFANHFSVLDTSSGAWEEVTSRVGDLFQ